MELPDLATFDEIGITDITPESLMNLSKELDNLRQQFANYTLMGFRVVLDMEKWRFCWTTIAHHVVKN